MRPRFAEVYPPYRPCGSSRKIGVAGSMPSKTPGTLVINKREESNEHASNDQAAQRSTPNAERLRGQALAHDLFHLVAETVEFAEGGVNVGRDPDALEFLVHDRHGEDVVFIKEIFHHSLRIGAVDVHIGDGARLI